jgi:hypothetical protein
MGFKRAETLVTSKHYVVFPVAVHTMETRRRVSTCYALKQLHRFNPLHRFSIGLLRVFQHSYPLPTPCNLRSRVFTLWIQLPESWIGLLQSKALSMPSKMRSTSYCWATKICRLPPPLLLRLRCQVQIPWPPPSSENGPPTKPSSCF